MGDGGGEGSVSGKADVAPVNESQHDDRRVPVDLSEGFGERLLGQLLDRSFMLPPHLIAPLVADEITKIGGRDVSILLQDYEQLTLVPLPGRRLVGSVPLSIIDSLAGEAFLSGRPVEEQQEHGVRMYLPLLDGRDEIGVLALTLESIGDQDRRLLRRLAALTSALLLVKAGYTDNLSKARRRGHRLSLAAEIQWSLLPPLSMNTPRVAVAGILEPAYEIAGDSLDYALNGHILHLAIIDAMGHGMNAALLATAAIGAYRHARRADVSLGELYALMDRAIDEQFGVENFVTAQMVRLDVETGFFQWVNAGHPSPMLIRGHRVIKRLESPTTLPVGFGGGDPQVSDTFLSKGDRVLFFTDGLTEQHPEAGSPFGEQRMIDTIEAIPPTEGVSQMARRLSHALMRGRGNITSDDATLFLLEWRGGAAHQLAIREI